MARVPSALPVGSLGSVAPQIGPTVFDATRASPAFGAQPSQLGRGLQDLGTAISQVALENQIQDNDRAFKLGVVELNRQRTESDKSFYSLEGDNAVQGVTGALSGLGGGYDEFIASQENDSVRERLALYAAGDHNDASGRYESHVRKERDRAETAADGALLNSLQERVGVDPHNFNETESIFLDIGANINESLDRQGLLTADDIQTAQLRVDEIKKETGKAVVAGFNTVFTTQGVDAAEEWLERPLHVDNTPATVIDNLRQKIIIGRGKNTSASLALGRDIRDGYNRGDEFPPDQVAQEIIRLRKIDSIASNDLANEILQLAGVHDKIKSERFGATIEQTESQVSLDRATPLKTSIEESLADQLRAKRAASARVEIAKGDALDVYSRDYNDPVLPIDTHEASTLVPRREQAEVASVRLGIPVPPLRSDEIDELGLRLLGLPTASGTVTNAEHAVDIMQNLQEVFGSQQAGAIADKLEKKSGSIAIALLLSNSDPTTAEQIVRGGRILAEGDRTAMLPSPTEAATVQERVLPGFFNRASSRGQAALLRAADAIYAEANPNLTIFDDTLYGEALNKAIGGGLEHEGNAISPPALDYTQRRFDHVLSNIDDTMVGPFFLANGEEWSVEELDQFWFDPAVNPQLKSVGLLTGKYTIQNPNGDFILDANGNEAILDLAEIERGGLIPLEQAIGIEQPTGNRLGGLNRSIQAHTAALASQSQAVLSQDPALPVNQERNIVTSPTELGQEVTTDTSMRQLFGSDVKQQAVVDRIKRKENNNRVGRNKNGQWKVHKDSLGKTTIGYGHLITKAEENSGEIIVNGVSLNYKKDGLTDVQIEDLLMQDLVKHAPIARDQLDNWNSFNHVRKAAVTELAFILGETKLSKFKNEDGTGTLDLMDRFQFGAAAESLLKNKKLKNQIKDRLDEIALMIATGRMI